MTWTKNSKINPKTGKPVNWQKPKEGHPWRQYSDRKVDVEVEVEIDIITVKEYLQALLDNWDSTEVTFFGARGDRGFTLNALSQKKVAAYICGVLRRNYMQ